MQCVLNHHNKSDDQAKHVHKCFRTLLSSPKKKKKRRKIIEKERDIEQLTGIMALKTRKSGEDESAKLLFSQQNQNSATAQATHTQNTERSKETHTTGHHISDRWILMIWRTEMDAGEETRSDRWIPSDWSMPVDGGRIWRPTNYFLFTFAEWIHGNLTVRYPTEMALWPLDIRYFRTATRTISL